jgi:hypothetical protein
MVSLLSSEVWQRIVLYVGIVYQCFTGTCPSIFRVKSYLEVEGSAFLRNLNSFLPSYTTSHPTKLDTVVIIISYFYSSLYSLRPRCFHNWITKKNSNFVFLGTGHKQSRTHKNLNRWKFSSIGKHLWALLCWMMKCEVLTIHGNLSDVQTARKDKNIKEYRLIVLCCLFMV